MATTLRTRPATTADLPGIRAILAAHDNDGPHESIDIVGPYVRHLIEHGHTLVVEDGGGIVAYGAVIDAGRAHHLADLFVRPDRLGEGIGRPLLERLFVGRWPRTTFASDDPRALPLYVRAGMTPFWPHLYVEGDAGAVPDPGPAIGIEPADAGRLADLEQEWTGVERRADHAHWASQASADPFVVLAGGTPVAIAHARARQIGSSRVVNRLVVRPDAEPLAPLWAALRRAGRGGPVVAGIQGPSPALRPLLDAGFRIIDRDTYMASEPDLIDPARLVPNSGML